MNKLKNSESYSKFANSKVLMLSHLNAARKKKSFVFSNARFYLWVGKVIIKSVAIFPTD